MFFGNVITYLTALGDDPYSAAMVDRFESQGILTDYILTIPNAIPGLYLIHNDEEGERSLFYYRRHAPVKQIFSDQYYQEATQNIIQFDYFYFSSISIAILPHNQHSRLKGLISKLKSTGCQIVFDTNYRPILWEGHEAARTIVTEFLPFIDIALPTFSDDKLLFGDSSPEECVKRYFRYGAKEVVVKRDTKPMILGISGGVEEVPVTPVK